MTEFTKNQIDILRHTKRNVFFGTTIEGTDFDDCEALFSLGYMTRRTAPRWTSDHYVYYITKSGIDALANATGICMEAIMTNRRGGKFRFELFMAGNSVFRSAYRYRSFDTATLAALKKATAFCNAQWDPLKSMSISRGTEKGGSHEQS